MFWLFPGPLPANQCGQDTVFSFHQAAFDFRCSRRITSFRADQISSTAHTFVSTNPSGKATSRITSSVTSVGIAADFFGQETQSIPVSASLARKDFTLFCKS